MEEIYRNKALNYGYISSMTLIVIILLINILDGNFGKFSGPVNLSDFSIKLVLILVVVTTYLTFVTPSFKVLGENKVLKKTPPRGDRGSRGNRGKLGDNSVCNECGDDLCFKKIMYTITKTINFWRQENGMDLLDTNYVIENEYIKDKVRKHCASKKFKKLLTKYGSNNNNISSADENIPICPKDISKLSKYKQDGEDDLGFGCGAYDYMLKMWCIWILIMLRYKSGMLFLESPGLNENDFVGMIEKEDGFKLGSTVEIEETGSEQYKVIDNTEFPFFKIKSSRMIKTVHLNKLTQIIPEKDKENTITWNNMFDANLSGIATKEKIIMLSPVRYDHDLEKYEMIGINKDFVSTIGKVPGGGKLSPFDEIKKYTSWYWGSDPNSKPKFVIVKKEQNKVCPECFNSSLCNPNNRSGGIKVKFTNSYKQLADLSIFKSGTTNIEGQEYYKPFSQLKESDFNEGKSNIDLNFSFFRAHTLVDESEPHTYFREYKPVGDVLLNNTHFKVGTTSDLSKCLPRDGLYSDDITKTPIVGKGSKSNNNVSLNNPSHNHIYTMLVSGDTKPAKDFTLVSRYVKNRGFKKNYEGITIWKPEAEDGYIALGYVVDLRPFDTGDRDSQNKPPRDIIATVPKNSLEELKFKNRQFIPFKKNPENITISYINTFMFDEHATYIRNIRSSGNILCRPITEVGKKESIEPDEFSSEDSPINALFKNKKYSIQKIFDNNNE
jgi:hypothetical protein